jgi:hypothetical protein
VGCAGAAGSGASCGAGAMGAAASSVIGSLLNSTANMTAEDRLVRENLINSLVAGVATGLGASGADTAAAAGAAQIEAQNNQVGIPGPKKNPLTTDLIKTYCATGTCTDEQVKLLVQVQNQMNEASGNNAMVVAGSVAVVAAIPALAALGPDALALALSNPAAAVNAGIITVETAAAIVTDSITPGVVVEGAVAKVGSAADVRTATQLRTQLAFQEAGLLDANGQLTSKALQGSDPIALAGGKINNTSVVKELTGDGSNITDWKKYTTQSVTMPNGQSLQIHFYMNSVTGKIDYVTPDFKIKGIVKP